MLKDTFCMTLFLVWVRWLCVKCLPKSHPYTSSCFERQVSLQARLIWNFTSFSTLARLISQNQITTLERTELRLCILLACP